MDKQLNKKNMKTKIEIRSIFGKLLFEFEKENNTIKDTVEEAVKQYANLRSANLRYADLTSANLRSANLRSADLTSADLRSANLRYADLTSADLTSADLTSADLTSADLTYANLRSANLRYADLPIFCKWSHSIQDGNIRIGCKIKSIEEWESFFDSDEEFETKRDTQDFKQIRAVFESYKAYSNALNS
ncbi:Type III effector pipB2 [Gammaproteobacteria bacterium]